LSKQIQTRRKSLYLSQEDLSKKIFVSRQTISNWENGKSYPDIQNLLLLSTIFGVSLDELVKGDIDLMKKKIANSEMDRYTKIMIIFIVLAMLSVGPSLLYLSGVWSFLPPLALWIIGMYSAIKVDKVKKKENIRTYKEIIAFMKNQDLDAVRNKRNKTKDFGILSLIVVGFGLVSALLALVSVYLFQG
jgi:transcriptional regulator with XRE-family HTH domain